MMHIKVAFAYLFLICAIIVFREVRGQDDTVELPPVDGGEDTSNEVITDPVGGDCSAVCETKLSEAMNAINALQQQLQAVNLTALQRIANLETSYYNVLSDKVTLLGSDLNTKTADLSSRLNTEVESIGLSIDNKVATASSKLTGDIARVSTNLQGSIDTTRTQLTNLENGKVQMLIKHNDLWKRNFRVVNNTIIKMKRRLNQITNNMGMVTVG